MKILNAQQIQQWDAYTIQQEPIASIDLMERAADACTKWLMNHQLVQNPVRIFCAKGNNGGDGLAIARQLLASGVNVSVYILEFGAKGTVDFQINLHRLHALTTDINFIQSETFLPAIHKNDLIIDALYGSGLNRPLTGLNADTVNHINASGATIISIDVPSGMYLDKSSAGNPVIKAKYTLSFQSFKLCFLMAENAAFFGEVEILNIGLHPDFLGTIDTIYEMVSPEKIASIHKTRKNFSHKGTYGHALLIAGNKGKMGAALLAARACLRSGVGLLTCNIPDALMSVIQTSVPEAMAVLREEKTTMDPFSTIGIGPGIGTGKDSEALLEQILLHYKKPVVIDADALNILGHHKDWLQRIPAGSVLSPHPKEFDRVFGDSANDFERLQKAMDISQTYPFVLILKGHYTLIAFNGKGIFNTTGNAGMATGGSGDVLTGILTGLLAQNYTGFDAAVLGVYLHGLAGDLALKQQSVESLLPSDIITHLGKAFQSISKKTKEVQE